MPQAPLFSSRTGQTFGREHHQILRGVSRSFNLSIRLLPKALQAPVAVGYLLARATDTVADTTTLPMGERQVLLDLLTQAIGEPNAAGMAQSDLLRLTQGFAAQQADPDERALMLALPQCLPLLFTLPEADQGSVRQVLGHITEGQHLDMARFGPGLHALTTEAELNHYTWLVAGCVGEFWTELCERHLPGYAREPQSEMMRLGREYGMGLQRLNIIRDAGADLRQGRCYWPLDLLATSGLAPALLAEWAQTMSKGHDKHPSTEHDRLLEKLAPLYEQWLNHTHQQLSCGLRYAMALKPLRLRLASALPALIGARTVALLRQAGPSALGQRIKMPRHEVRQLLWRIALGLGSPAVLTQQFRQLSGPSKPSDTD